MRLKRLICLLAVLALAAGIVPLPGNTARAAAKYYITVDLTNQIVTVYDNGNISESGIVRQMICSTGRNATPTPVGTYTLPAKWKSTERTEWYYFPVYNCYAKWATRIVGGILFHSVLYTSGKAGPTRASVNALGSKASHGCVRLRVADAKWIAQNCPAGTRCRVYNSGKTDAALRKRLLNKSFSRGGESYDHFLGRAGADGEPVAAIATLSRGSGGERVKELQRRLKALGFLNDTVDGKFGSNTEAAVKYFQAALGLKKTGKVNDALWKRIFADDAPTGTYVTLSQGMSGPAVAVLQGALADMKLYDGAVDGSFSAAVTKAVKRYQECFGASVTGKAPSALQKEMLRRAAEIKAEFGDGEYVLVAHEDEIPMARTKGGSTVALRATASTKAKALAKLKADVEVEVLSKGSKWTQVAYGKKTGYIRNKYLTFFTATRTSLSYEPAATPEPTATPEIFIPTATPEVFIPTATPSPSPTPEPTATPSPTPTATPSQTPELTSEWDFLLTSREAADGAEAVMAAAGAELEGTGLTVDGD